MNYTEQLLTVMNSVGDRELIVICDFDGTITTADSDKTMNAMAKYCGYDSEFAKARDALYQEYAPQVEKAEGDEKRKLERKWWTAQMNLLQKAPLTPEAYVDAANKLNFTIREEAAELLAYCEEHEIPVFVVSAGLGNLAIPLLAFSGNLSMNMRVLSNFVRYEEGKAISYTPVVTPSNKSDHLFMELSFHDKYYAVIFGDKNSDLNLLPPEISTSVLVE
ncbi:MAG: HAD-IB family phosphatase [Oscillospiraceae bacterium]|nr:HAD-IB family phosphatase [Oscillospiraceae bacterium]